MNDDHGLSGLYALHALEPDEHERYEKHLLTCDACRDEVHQFQETLAMVGSSDTQLGQELPAGLRASVLRAIDESTPSASIRPIGAARRSRPRWVTAPRVLVAAAAVAIAAIGVGSVVRSSDDPADATASLLAELRANGARPFPMQGSVATSASLLRDTTATRAVLVLDGLAPISADQTYQAWTIAADNAIRPATVFRPESDGSTIVSLTTTAQTASVAVTVEPKGGSRQPTTPVVLFTSLS